MLPRISRVVAGIVSTCVVAMPQPTMAEESAVAALDEATFLRRVRERSPRVRTFDTRRRAADAAVAAAAPLPNPTLGYEREAVSGLDADEFVRLGWTLDLSGRRGLVRGAARAGADAERASVARDAAVLGVDARLAYLDAVYAKARVAELDRSRASLTAVVDTLRSRAKQGDASDYDAERATLELETLDDERAEAQRHNVIAQLRLGALVGEPRTRYDASGALTLPAKPGAQLEPKRDDVEAARARARQADRETAAARRTWLPRFELMGGLKRSSGSGGEGLGYVLGVATDLPLFDRGGAAAARAHAEAARWRDEAAALASEATAESEQARRDLLARIDQATAYAAGPAKRAGDLERRAIVTYREGDRPILELLDVQRSARHAAVRSLELVYEARRAELALQRALGGTP